MLSEEKTCLLTVDVEEDIDTQNLIEKDYLGVDSLIDNYLLDILDKFEAKATFFIVGNVINERLNAIKKIAGKHEIACHGGLTHISISNLPKEKQKTEISQLQKQLERIKKPVVGYRAVKHIITCETLSLLENMGFVYDSSVMPRYFPLKKYVGYKGIAPLHPYHPSSEDYKKRGEMCILELPISIFRIINVPIYGHWIRYLGEKISKALINSKSDYLNIAMHSWDFIVTRKYGKNAGRKFCSMLNGILDYLYEKNYKFKTASHYVSNNLDWVAYFVNTSI